MYFIGEVNLRHYDLGGIHVLACIFDVALDLGGMFLQGVGNMSWGSHGDDVVGEAIVWRDRIFLNEFSEDVVWLTDNEN